MSAENDIRFAINELGIAARQVMDGHGRYCLAVDKLKSAFLELQKEAALKEKRHKATIDDLHQLFDKAGVPKADHVPCDDPECQTKVGHRLRTLLAVVRELRELQKNNEHQTD